MRQTRNGSHRLGLSEGGEGHEMELKGEATHLYRVNAQTGLYGRKDANVPPESFAIDISQV